MSFQISDDTGKYYNTIEEDFEPYLQWLKIKGLEKKAKVRYNIDSESIDSMNRIKISKNIPKHLIGLEDNPLTIKNYDLIIKVPNNIIKELEVGDKISLTGISKVVKKFSAFNEKGETIIKFFKGKKYIEINTNPNIKATSELNIYQKFFDTTKVYVIISGIQGVKKNIFYGINNITPYDSTSNNSSTKEQQLNNDSSTSYIGNIPVSYINDIHRIYILPPDEQNILFNPDKFYVLLPFPSDGTGISAISSSENDNYTISLEFEHYNFIPMNEMIADYPITNEHVKGFHLVKSINLNQSYITVDIFPPIGLNYKITGDLFLYENFGGSSVYLNIIDKIEYGYPYQNEYTILLNKIYNNVIQVRLVDSIFGNFAKTFFSSGAGKNNRIYFQNIENIEQIQFIELDEGFYTRKSLKSEIEKKFSILKRSIDTTNFGYDLKYNVFVEINENTDEVTLTSYKSKTLQKPINNVSPLINQNDTGIGDGTYTIVIEHPNHGISYETGVGLFEGFIDHLGIPIESLNGIHEIKIIDPNKYSFIINNVNLSEVKRITNGGRNVVVFIPSPMRYFFNFADTAGSVLGFRRPGFDTSITGYSYIIKNSDSYINEIKLDVNGNPVTIKNNSIKLYKFNYFLMECNIGNSLSNSNTKNTFFTKFRITEDKIILNESLNTSIFFYDPIHVLDRITFKFFNPDRTLVDFGDIDHSIVFEIIRIDNMPLLGNINASYPLL